ncbi:MAG: homoserine kinase [Flavobacteriaceae bacterium]
MDSIRIFSPASVANISCGFDVLGLALETVGDLMTVTKVPEPGVRITRISGFPLPLDTQKNVAGVAALTLLAKSEFEGGFEIEIEKKIKPGSGIGSSAASASGAVWALNELLGHPYSKLELVEFAMEGERLASGAAHADNVAPALFGGFTLVRSYEPLDVIRIPAPEDLFATIVHPQIEIKTADSRKILKKSITLADGIKQWGNLGGLVAGLYTEDYALIGRSLVDHIIEPTRAILIPGFDEVKHAALEAGALGCGISGSGPSIFALSKGETIARETAAAMRDIYGKLEIDVDIHVSNINPYGIKELR